MITKEMHHWKKSLVLTVVLNINSSFDTGLKIKPTLLFGSWYNAVHLRNVRSNNQISVMKAKTFTETKLDAGLYEVYKHFFPPPDHLISCLNLSHTLPPSPLLYLSLSPPLQSVWSHYLITIQDVPSVRACWSQKVNRAVTTLSPAYAIRCWRIGSCRHAAIWLGNCQQSI